MLNREDWIMIRKMREKGGLPARDRRGGGLFGAHGSPCPEARWATATPLAGFSASFCRTRAESPSKDLRMSVGGTYNHTRTLDSGSSIGQPWRSRRQRPLPSSSSICQPPPDAGP